MKLTLKDLQRFLSDDTFYHFVARKHGCFIKDEDDLSEVRYKAIAGVLSRYNAEFEYEDEKHLYSSVEMTVWNAIRTMLKSKTLQKNNLPIDSECTLLRGDGDEQWSLYEVNAISESKEYDNTLQWLMSSAEKKLDTIQMFVLNKTVEGFTIPEIAEELECSAENVRQRLRVIIRQLKNISDAEKGEIQYPVRRIRAAVKRESVRAHKAAPERRSAASDFLNS
jgi:DNA-directed RNA polymerase specialized sigma24 family protein